MQNFDIVEEIINFLLLIITTDQLPFNVWFCSRKTFLSYYVSFILPRSSLTWSLQSLKSLSTWADDDETHRYFFAIWAIVGKAFPPVFSPPGKYIKCHPLLWCLIIHVFQKLFGEAPNSEIDINSSRGLLEDFNSWFSFCFFVSFLVYQVRHN